MTFDLFFGVPGQRVIRSTELATYYNFERGRPKSTRARSPAELPPALRPIIGALQAERPQAPEGEVPLPEQARYTLYKTAFSASFATEQAAILRTNLSMLALDNEVLYHNASSGGWIDAAKPKGEAKPITAFTSERCIMKYSSADDRTILLDEDWFVPDRFFCFTPQPGQFMQILNRGDGYLIEFRAGLDRPINYAVETDAARVDKFLEGYLAGENMNRGDYLFALLSADANSGLPSRDGEGRWIPRR